MSYILIIWIISLLSLEYSSKSSDISLLGLFITSDNIPNKYFVAAIVVLSAPIITIWDLYENYKENK